MSKILKNNTASPVSISDTGITVPASGQYIIPSQDYLLWAASSNVITYIGNSTLTVNDGGSDLSISNGTDLIKGLFPQKIGITSGDDFTPIGHVGDRLKVDAQVTTATSSYYRSLLEQHIVYSAAFFINAASSSTDNNLILLKNPIGSGKTMVFLRLSGNANVANESSLFKVFQNPTITNDGTAYTPLQRTVGGPVISSISEVYSLPTISSRGYELSMVQSGQNTNSQSIIDAELLEVHPGSSILLTARPRSNNRVQVITFVWAEIPL